MCRVLIKKKVKKNNNTMPVDILARVCWLMEGRGTFLALPGSVNCEEKVEWTLTP